MSLCGNRLNFVSVENRWFLEKMFNANTSYEYSKLFEQVRHRNKFLLDLTSPIPIISNGRVKIIPVFLTFPVRAQFHLMTAVSSCLTSFSHGVLRLWLKALIDNQQALEDAGLGGYLQMLIAEFDQKEVTNDEKKSSGAKKKMQSCQLYPPAFSNQVLQMFKICGIEPEIDNEAACEELMGDCSLDLFELDDGFPEEADEASSAGRVASDGRLQPDGTDGLAAGRISSQKNSQALTEVRQELKEMILQLEREPEERNVQLEFAKLFEDHENVSVFLDELSTYSAEQYLFIILMFSSIVDQLGRSVVQQVVVEGLVVRKFEELLPLNSRQLQMIVLNINRAHPSVAVNDLCVQLTYHYNENRKVEEFLVRMVKDKETMEVGLMMDGFLNSSHLWNATTISVINAILEQNRNGNIVTENVAKIIEAVRPHSEKLKSSLKFSKFIFFLVNNSLHKLSASEIMVLSEIVEVNQTFLKRKIQSMIAAQLKK